MKCKTHDYKCVNLETESWFDHEYYYKDYELDQEIVYDVGFTTDMLRAKRIQLFPTYHQRKILMQWIGISRWVYNHSVAYAKVHGAYTNKRRFRDNVKTNLPEALLRYCKESKMPQRIIVETIMDVSKAYKTAFANKAAGNIDKFRLRFRKKNKPRQGFVVACDCFNKTRNAFATKALGDIKSSEPFPAKRRDSRLVYEHGNFYMHCPDKCMEKLVEGRKPECSLDPGLCTFQTLYDGDNCMKFGNRPEQEIVKLLKKIHKTKHRESEARIRRYHRRLYDRIRHLVDDLHWKTALFLVTHYDNILLGNLSTKSVVSRKLKLPKKCKDPMLLLRHYVFQQRLAAKAEQYGATMSVVDESYTSKTCSDCFKIKNNLGGSRAFKCSCGFVWDRDFNGARNIMQKQHGAPIKVYKKK